MRRSSSDGYPTPPEPYEVEPAALPPHPGAATVPGSKSEELWMTYAVKPNLPLRSKIEQLTILFRLSVEEMAVLLESTPTAIKLEVEALREEWKSLGRVPDADCREMERGRAIAELNRLAADIDTAMSTGLDKDPRLLNLKLTVIERRARLQGLDIDKRDIPTTSTEEDEETSLQRAERQIQELPSERLEELVQKLQ